jgi:hypothetical protein
MSEKQSKTNNIYDQYRQMLEIPHLTDEEIDKMRPHVIHIARTICEHVWGKNFY